MTIPSSKKLGLIAGNGKFPILFAREARQKGYHITAAGVKGDTSFLLRFFVDKLSMFSVGELKKLFQFFKNEGIVDVIMAGQVNPNNLFDQKIKMDDEFAALFAAIIDRKADTIFNAVADKLNQEGLKLLDSTFLLKDYLAPKGTLTHRGPTLKELDDISFGCTLAKEMGGIDVGQTVVVKDKAIIAIEAMEGTDRAMMRGGFIARQGAVVVKMSKPNQDLRFDIPVIGPRTIQKMIKVNAKCLAVESGKTLIIDRPATIKLANKNGLCIVAL